MPATCSCGKAISETEPAYRNFVHNIVFCLHCGKEAMKDIWYLKGIKNPTLYSIALLTIKDSLDISHRFLIKRNKACCRLQSLVSKKMLEIFIVL
jgi:hypothetical protein